VKEFKGKVAVITGAGRGMGRGIASHCAQKGMKLVLADIRLESLRRTAADLQALGAETLTVQTDVSRLEDVENLAKQSYETFGGVDLLVNDAGVSTPATVLESSLDDWNWVMGVNFYGMLYGVRTFVPRMIEQGTVGHVVNVASLAGVVEAVDSYHVSKRAVVALTESLYHDLAESAPQIKVSVFLPGLVNTELYRSEEARPERFNKTAVTTTEPNEAMVDFFQTFGFPVEEAVRVLFEGLAQEKLYIGPKAFQKQSPKILDVIQKQAENIVKERNPEHPRDLGPTSPA
jgi:NAD(P)-dependent dehydrogenase (short-subunit alcohol dehydrogenase family)